LDVENTEHFLSKAGFSALSAMGAAGTVDLALKLAFDLQFPSSAGSTGKFRHTLGVRGCNCTLLPTQSLGACALGTGGALLRYPAKKHYLSDILMYTTVGYVAGEYVGSH
jgi:hypothetical protein